MDCLLDQDVFITSHRNQQLQDRNGAVRLDPGTGTSQRWKLSDAGRGRVFITSHRNQQLEIGMALWAYIQTGVLSKGGVSATQGMAESSSRATVTSSWKIGTAAWVFMKIEATGKGGASAW